MDWHDRPTPVDRMFQGQMTAPLVQLYKARPFQRTDDLARMQRRQPDQVDRGDLTVTGNANPVRARFSTGNDRPALIKQIR